MKSVGMILFFVSLFYSVISENQEVIDTIEEIKHSLRKKGKSNYYFKIENPIPILNLANYEALIKNDTEHLIIAALLSSIEDDGRILFSSDDIRILERFLNRIMQHPDIQNIMILNQELAQFSSEALLKIEALELENEDQKIKEEILKAKIKRMRQDYSKIMDEAKEISMGFRNPAVDASEGMKEKEIYTTISKRSKIKSSESEGVFVVRGEQ